MSYGLYRIRIATLVLATVAFFQGTPAAAQPAQMGVIEALELARSQNPLINERRAGILAKQGERLTGFGLYTPQISYFREGIPTGAGGFGEQRWTVSQAIDFPLESYYRLNRLGTETEARRRALEAGEKDVRVAVKKAYADLLHAQEIVHLRQEEVQLGTQLRDAAEVRVEVGEASELELMKADLELAEARTNLEEAYRRFQNTRYALFQHVGLDPDDQGYEITFPDTLVYVSVAIDQEQVLAGLSGQPELRRAALDVEAAELRIRETRSRMLPALTFDLYAQDYGTGFDHYGVQFGVRMPLWAITNHRGAMQQARAETQTLRWQQESVALAVKRAAEEAWHGFETSRSTIQRFHDSVGGRANELLALTQEGYRMGELDLLTLLDTQRTYLNSQIRYYDALHDYYHRLIELERYLGREIIFSDDTSTVAARRDTQR